MLPLVIGCVAAVAVANAGEATSTLVAGATQETLEPVNDSMSASLVGRFQLGDGQVAGVRTLLADDYAVVADYMRTGEADDYDNEPELGIVYVQKRSGVSAGKDAQKLAAPEGTEMRHFGIAMATNGRRLAITAEARRGPCSQAAGCIKQRSNSVYIYTRSKDGLWELESTIVAKRADGTADQNAGNSLALVDDTLFVGSSSPSEDGSENGVIYTFHLASSANWEQAATITAPDAKAGRSFGWSLAADREHLLVGQPKYKKTGALYLYRRGQGGAWMLKQKVLPPIANMECAYGHSVALDRDSALVGNRNSKCNVALYGLKGGVMTPLDVVASAGHAGVANGEYVSLSGDLAAVSMRGGVLIFRRSPGAWREATFVSRPDVSIGQRFPMSLALRGTTLAVGSAKGVPDPKQSSVLFYSLSARQSNRER